MTDNGPEVAVELDERGRLVTSTISVLPLANGRTVLMADVWINHDGMGEGVVLAVPHDGEYVTWHVYRHVRETHWVAENGDYHHDRETAIAAYHERRGEQVRRHG